jgi:hypothetical protein
VTAPMFLGVLGFPPLPALLLFMTAMTQPSGIKRAGTAGPGPQGGKVGTPRQSSGGAPAAFDYTVLVIGLAERNALIDTLVWCCSRRVAGRDTP